MESARALLSEAMSPATADLSAASVSLTLVPPAAEERCPECARVMDAAHLWSGVCVELPRAVGH